ncbi:hypothetical protein DKAM_0315 [Desulfurococcus amylolyticus 1221n]|uniref:Uncharacterized protein n=1 Tax=Desulfurococcus amylolyticus (strain DSM 18924 / JCM 16383 / VKM B-2413 / 1221n) TaxID=490899 RepID=B8D3G0_DESA1|nr:hypothetical protein DKAM_0315 [Desulfurococcus amylolyticus 1221n]
MADRVVGASVFSAVFFQYKNSAGRETDSRASRSIRTLRGVDIDSESSSYSICSGII